MNLFQNERLQTRDEIDVKTEGVTSEWFTDIVDGR